PFGLFTITGQINLAFSHSGCLFNSASDAITRTMDVTISGRAGGSYTVKSTTDGGHRLTFNGANSYTFEILGMQRTLKDSSGNTKADITTKTTTGLGVTGTSRFDRVVNGGT